MRDDAFGKHLTLIRVASEQHAAPSVGATSAYGTFLLLVMTLVYSASAATAADATTPKPPTSAPTTQIVAHSAPARAVQQFHDFLKSADTPGALAMLAVSPKPVRDADRRIKRLVATLSGRDWDFAILDAKETGDVAVVLINDYLKDGRKTIDIKPWYLIRQDGQWKLLGKFTDFELKEYSFDEARLAEYRALEKWSLKREHELRKEQPDCGC